MKHVEKDRKTARSHSHSTGRSGEGRRVGRADEVTSSDLRQTVNELLRILVLRRWLFFVPFCLATTAAFIASHYVPRTYEAHTTFEQANDQISVNLPPTLKTSTFGYFLSTLEQDIKSDEVMGPIVEELGLAGDLPRNADGSLTEEGDEIRERIGRAMADRVYVVAYQKSPYRNVIELQYTGADAVLKAELLAQMKEGYKRLVRQRVSEELEDARAWYGEQAEAQRAVVEEIDRRLTGMHTEHPDVDPANPFSVGMQLATLRGRLGELRRTRARLGAQISAREEFLAAARNQPRPDGTGGETAPGALLSPMAQRLQAALEASQARVLELTMTRGMTERHPDIVAERELQERYARELGAEAQGQGVGPVKALVSGRLGGVWQPVVAQAEMELASFVEEREQNAVELADAEQRVAEVVRMQGQVGERRQEVGRLEEELARARKDYGTYSGLVGQCERGLTVENQNRGILFTDVVPARGGVAPASPLAKTVVLLSVLAGLASGALLVVLAELFDRRFRTTAQVTRSLALPILECIDEIVTPPERRRRFVRRAILVPTLAVVLLGMVGISGGLSYLSLNRPQTYERLMGGPRSAWAQLAGSGEGERNWAQVDRPA